MAAETAIATAEFLNALLLVTCIVIWAYAVARFVVWLIVTYIPMPDIFQKVIMVVVAVFLILYVIGLLSGSNALPHLALGHHP